MFREYPYINFNELNLDWILKKIYGLSNDMETFVNVNTIKYADPLTWSIANQYEQNTLVQDASGVTFLSKRPVPTGVSLENGTYWLKVADFEGAANIIRSQIGANEGSSATATAARAVNDLVWRSGYLYRITAPMIAGDSYTDSNCSAVILDDFINEIRVALATEINDREDAEGDLSDRIGAEVTARELADNALNAAITNEIATRTEEVNEINNRLDGLSAPFNVVSFGADPTGVEDSTAAFQACLNALAANHTKDHAGAVVPNGHYRISHVTIPEGIELSGSYSFDGYTKNGTWIYCESTSESAFTLSNGSAIRNMAFYYPQQTDRATPVEYAPTLDLATTTSEEIAGSNSPKRIFVENVYFLNAYIAMDFSKRHESITVNHVNGYAIKTGMIVDYSSDSDRFTHVHFNSNALANSGADFTLLKNWTRKNGTAFIVKYADWEYFTECFSWGYRYGFVIDTSTYTSNSLFNAVFLKCGADACGCGVKLMGASLTDTNMHYGIIFDDCFFCVNDNLNTGINAPLDYAVIVEDVRDATFSKCRFHACAKGVFSLNAFEAVNVCDCSLWDYGFGGAESWAVNIEASAASVPFGSVLFNGNIVNGQNRANCGGLRVVSGSGAVIGNNAFMNLTASLPAIATASNYVGLRAVGNSFNGVATDFAIGGGSHNYVFTNKNGALVTNYD